MLYTQVTFNQQTEFPERTDHMQNRVVGRQPSPHVLQFLNGNSKNFGVGTTQFVIRVCLETEFEQNILQICATFFKLPLNNYFLNMALLSSKYQKRILSVALPICLSLPLDNSKSQYRTQHQQMVITKDTRKFRITLQ